MYDIRRYKATIWTEDGKPGEHVTVEAVSLEDAEQQLERRFGFGTVFDLHNEDDAARPR